MKVQDSSTHLEVPSRKRSKQQNNVEDFSKTHKSENITKATALVDQSLSARGKKKKAKLKGKHE